MEDLLIETLLVERDIHFLNKFHIVAVVDQNVHVEGYSKLLGGLEIGTFNALVIFLVDTDLIVMLMHTSENGKSNLIKLVSDAEFDL